MLPVIGALLASLPTVDLAYHLRAGGELLDSGRVPMTDTYTFTVAGSEWLNQQWGAQAILAVLHRIGGWEALAVARAVLVGVIFGLVLWAARRAGASDRQAALLTLAAFAVSMGALALRPQLFGMAFFALAVALAAERHRTPGILWALVPLSAVWANVHGSFFLGPTVLGVAWLSDMHDREPRATRALLITLVAAAVTLLNPYGFGVWTYAAGLSTSSLITSSITEWQPTSIRTPLGALFFASAMAVGAVLARRSRVTPWPTLLWLGLLFALGVYAVRGTAWWPIGAAIVVAGLIDQPAVEQVRREPPRRLNDVLVATLVIAVGLLLPWWKPVDPETGRRDLLSFAPAGITSAVRDLAGPDDRLLVAQPLGSWFEYAVPSVPVYVDSRFEVFGEEIWAEYVSLVNLGEEWSEVLDARGVTVIVTDPERTGDLGSALAEHDGWRRVYGDGDGEIFVRSER